MTRRTPFPFGHFPPGEPHIEKADRRDHNERSQGHDDQCLSSRHELALVCYLSRTAPSAALVVWCVGGGRNVVVMSAPYRCLIAPCGGNREDRGFRHIGSVGLGEREQMPKQDNISISLQRGGAAPWIARSGPAMASKTPVTKLLTIVLKSVTFRESRSSRDAFARALSEAERVRCFRADLQSAPERLWASFSSVLRPRCGVLPLDWDRRGRVTPAGTESQEAWPGAEPGCESPGESRGEAPEGERAPDWRASAPGHWQAATFVGAARNWLDAPFGAPPPFFCRRRILLVVVGKARAPDCVARMILLSATARSAGEGDHTKCGGGGVRRLS